jgi:hypothetical protein
MIAAAIRGFEPNADAINVCLVNPQSAVYHVLGEVNSPGSFPLMGRETVLEGNGTVGLMGWSFAQSAIDAEPRCHYSSARCK